MSATKLMSETFLKSLLPRRSVYQLSNSLPISKEEVVKIVRNTVEHIPSAFNSQTTRAIVVFGDHSSKIWKEFAWKPLQAHVPAETFKSQTAPKLEAFGGAAGTVLFFEDTNTIKGYQEKFATYAAKFPEWAAHSSGASQIAIWSALALENVGANLQHYNPIIDEAVIAEFGVPAGWQLTAQLVFGGIQSKPDAPEHLDPKETVKVIGN